MGFVSNSSSSSFVIIGFKSDKESEEEIILKKKDGKDLYIETMYIEGCKESFITGYKLGEWGDCDELAVQDFSGEDVTEAIELISEYFKVKKDKIKLYMGTHPC